MNDVCVFTQTYGNDRGEIFDWKLKDENFNWFIQQFHSILSFHNTSDEFIENVISRYPIWDEIVTIRGVNYTESFRKIIEYVKESNFTKFIFLQDDCFSANRDKKYYESLVDYIKNEKFDMLNLSYTLDDDGKFKTKQLNENFSVFENTNHDLVNSNGEAFYYFDDSAFCASVDFLDNIYDENYFQIKDIWHAEVYLHRKFKDIVIPRNCLNVEMFRNSNFIGPNSWNRENELKWLENSLILNEQVGV